MFFIAQSPFLKALGWALIHSLWQFAVLVLLYFCIVKLFPNVKAAVKHSLSLYLLIAGAVWFVFNFLYQYYFFHEDNLFLSYSIPIADTAISNNWFSLRIWINNSSPYFSVLYLAMISVFLCRLVSWFFNNSRHQTESIQKVPLEWRLFTQKMAAYLGITKKITLQLSSFVNTPQVIGFVKPVILLPFSCISNLSPVQIEAVLLHELAHIKRSDYFINIVTVLCSVFFFFNPFARHLISHLRDERENACDDWVLQFCYPAKEYASALLQLEKSRASYNYLQLAAAGNKKKQLLFRIQRILKLSQPPQPSLFIWGNVAVIIAFLLLLITPSYKTNSLNTDPNFIPLFTAYVPFTDMPAENDNTEKPHVIQKNNSPVKVPIPSKIIKIEDIADTEENMVPLIENVLQITDENKIIEQTFSQPVLTKAPEIAYSYALPEEPANEIKFQNIEQQPYLPSNSFTYYYIPDSAEVQANIKEYAETILKLQIESKKEVLLNRQKNEVQIEKQLSNQLEALQQLIQEKQQLAEGRKLQLETLEKVIREQQKKLQYKAGKKRIVYI
jgi:beta-lactamase regulating signal transducer with metallopeptidase domain